MSKTFEKHRTQKKTVCVTDYNRRAFFFYLHRQIDCAFKELPQMPSSVALAQEQTGEGQQAADQLYNGLESPHGIL